MSNSNGTQAYTHSGKIAMLIGGCLMFGSCFACSSGAVPLGVWMFFGGAGVWLFGKFKHWWNHE